MDQSHSHDRPSDPLPTDGILQLSSVRDRSLIRLLAFADRRQIDAAPLVLALASEFPGGGGERLKRFAASLAPGVPVIDALEQAPGTLDRTTVTALRLAQQDGTMPEMYQSLLAEHELDDSEAGSPVSDTAAEFVQIAIGFLVAGGLLTFLTIFIVPTFQVMFSEFGLSLPSLMIWLIAFMQYLPMLLIIGFIAIVIFLLLRAPAINASIRVKWNPLAGAHLVPSSVSLRSLLAVAVQSGRPLASGLPILARHCELPGRRRRLNRTCERIEGGEQPWQSLAAEKLITQREAEALSLTESGSTQAWLLRWSAATRSYRRVRRGHLLTRTVSLVISLLFGLLVAWTAIAVFMVLASLITALS